MSKTLAEKIGVSSKRLSEKIQKVMRDDPELSRKAAIGKAAGILAGKTGKEFKPKKKMGNS